MLTEERFNEIVNSVLDEVSLPNAKEFKDEFMQTEIEDLIIYHSNFGRWIRNTYNLWDIKHEPETIDGIDVSPNHPDALSMKIIESVWDKLQRYQALQELTDLSQELKLY